MRDPRSGLTHAHLTCTRMPPCEPFLPTVWSLREPANLHTAAPPPATHNTLRGTIPSVTRAHRAKEETSAPIQPTDRGGDSTSHIPGSAAGRGEPRDSGNQRRPTGLQHHQPSVVDFHQSFVPPIQRVAVCRTHCITARMSPKMESVYQPYYRWQEPTRGKMCQVRCE